MIVTLTKDFVALPYEEGTVENMNRTATAELADTQNASGGITLHPGEKFAFSSQLYARSAFAGVKLALVASASGSGGGGIDEYNIATDAEISDLIDEIYGSGTASGGGTALDGDAPVDDDF